MWSNWDMERQKSRKSFRRRKPSNNGHGGGSLPMTTIREKEEALFISAYLNSFNARQAYISIRPDVTTGTAGVEGSKWLKKPHIIAEVDRQLTVLFETVNLSNEQILAEQLKLAFVDIRGFFDDDNNLKEMSQLNIAQQSAIEQIEVQENYEGHGDKRKNIGKTTRVRFYSRQKALEALMKYRGMIRDGGNTFNFKVNNNIEKAQLTVDIKALKEKLGAERIIDINRQLTEKDN